MTHAIGIDRLKGPCPQPSEMHRARALSRQDALTKPPGALGRLEDVAVQLAALQARDRPSARHVAIILFAGDHGVTAQGVSPYPSAVTVQMVRNFVAGGAAISVMAREIGARLEVVDAGTLAELAIDGVVTDKPRRGTRDFSSAPAMTPDEVAHALGAGWRAVGRLAGTAVDLVVFGEMGIGNTTSAAALAAAMTGRSPIALAGAGTGLGTAGIAHKSAVIERALKLHRLDDGPVDPMVALAAVGGLEIAALTGAIVAAAMHRLPVLVDGFIASVAALAAVRLNPGVAPWLILGHRSAERGHATVLEALGGEPLVDLGLRLGEGSGAAAAVPLVRLACALHNGMATFAEAAVASAGND